MGRTEESIGGTPEIGIPPYGGLFDWCVIGGGSANYVPWA